MDKIIFSLDKEKSAITLVNKSFHNLFPSIDKIPHVYTKNDEFGKLLNDSLIALFNTNLGRIIVDIKNDKYVFDIDRMDGDIFIFSGEKLDSENSIKNKYAQKLLRLLADNLPDMLWAKDVHGHYIFANQAICDNLLMAKDTSEPIGNSDVFFALREREKHKDLKDWHTFGELCFNSDEIVLEHMKPMRFEEYGNIKGKLVYLEVHKAPFFDENGRLLGTVGSGRDITVEVLAKEELKEKDKLMAQQAKMAAMGEMIENIAHQWRQPLSMISSLVTTTIVEKELSVISEKELNEKLLSIKDIVEHLSNTIDDFRLFFKPNRERQDFNIKDTFDKTLQLIKPKLKENQIEIIKNIENVEILGLENELIQVIINLLNNAKDALENKKQDRKLIFISVKKEKEKEKIVIKIKDNAGGIKEDIINRVFEPYFTTKHQSQGTGVGLYMSEVIVAKHMKGLISVENKKFNYEEQKHKGALFKIVLPL